MHIVAVQSVRTRLALVAGVAGRAGAGESRAGACARTAVLAGVG